MRASELADSVETIESAAGEGALLAAHAADDRTKTTFVRVRASELSEEVDHEIQKLSDAEPQPGVARDLTRAVDLASAVSRHLGDLAATPRDRAAAREAADALRSLAGDAERLRGALP